MQPRVLRGLICPWVLQMWRPPWNNYVPLAGSCTTGHCHWNCPQTWLCYMLTDPSKLSLGGEPILGQSFALQLLEAACMQPRVLRGLICPWVLQMWRPPWNNYVPLAGSCTTCHCHCNCPPSWLCYILTDPPKLSLGGEPILGHSTQN